MNPNTVFLTASIVVLASILVSLFAWIRIKRATGGLARAAACFFVTCFGLYAVGQTLVILQTVGIGRGFGNVPSYCYALAAVLFAFGSWKQLKSVGGAR